MKTIIAFLLMTGVALASPCDDDRKTFERAKKYGAREFKCTDHYDGSASSSFVMDPEDHKKFTAAELERNRKRIQQYKRKQK